jgi:hypothetical protein
MGTTATGKTQSIEQMLHSGSVAKGLLGLAGAYLLREGAESGWFPHSAGILAAFAYALIWIVVAGRIPSRDQATSTVYALASAVIFLGLVWENAVRSALVSPPIAALLIVVYLCTGQLVAWVRDRGEIAALTVSSTVALSLMLFLTSHNLIPFNTSLLCAAAASELAACRGRWLRQRWMAAWGTDIAIFITSWIFSRSATLPAGYAPLRQSSVLAIQLALVLVYLASTGYRTLAAQTVVTAFEIGQNAVAIGLFILGQAAMAPASSQRLLAAVICNIVALGSYAASWRLDQKGAHRSSTVYGIFGGTLLTAGTLCALSVAGRL